MESVYLLLGANVGDCLNNLRICLTKLSRLGNIKAISSIYQTKAWGNTDQPDFFNLAVAIETSQAPPQFLKAIQSIEQEIGRVRFEKWGPRMMDIDILFFGKRIISSENLKVPHPYLPDRRFALTALAEIAPNVVHPALEKSVAELLKECGDILPVTKLEIE